MIKILESSIPYPTKFWSSRHTVKIVTSILLKNVDPRSWSGLKDHGFFRELSVLFLTHESILSIILLTLFTVYCTYCFIDYGNRVGGMVPVSRIEHPRCPSFLGARQAVGCLDCDQPLCIHRKNYTETRRTWDLIKPQRKTFGSACEKTKTAIKYKIYIRKLGTPSYFVKYSHVCFWNRCFKLLPQKISPIFIQPPSCNSHKTAQRHIIECCVLF